jgi:hypothetical protein
VNNSDSNYRPDFILIAVIVEIVTKELSSGKKVFKVLRYYRCTKEILL